MRKYIGFVAKVDEILAELCQNYLYIAFAEYEMAEQLKIEFVHKSTVYGTYEMIPSYQGLEDVSLDLDDFDFRVWC